MRYLPERQFVYRKPQRKEWPKEICFPLNHRQFRMLFALFFNDTRLVLQSPKEGQKV